MKLINKGYYQLSGGGGGGGAYQFLSYLEIYSP